MDCYERREVEFQPPACHGPEDCVRHFHLYLPRVLCEDAPRGEDAAEDAGVGTLPLVFAVHCFGCTAESMTSLVAPADHANVVLVIPEGLRSSFNAVHCCGHAVAKDVDDVGFFKHIQSTLSDEYSFVLPEYSYAVGWSNGGFMVVHAASLFRAISPISGYLHEFDPAVTKGGSFCVDGICVDAPKVGKGIFFHHGLDDTFVRPTGCCHDPDQPRCCCGIAADTCVSVMDVARNWAAEVNGCEAVEEDNGKGDGSDKEGEGEGKEGGNGEQVAAAKNGEESESAGENDNIGEDGNVKQDAALASLAPDGTASGPTFSGSYVDESRGIECLTATGMSCKANTTICLHAGVGHFNSPSFGEAFPFTIEVIEFFAKDACEIHNGMWDGAHNRCVCAEERGGMFCLGDPGAANVVSASVAPSADAAKDVVGTPVILDDGDDVYNIDDVYINSEAASKGPGKGTMGIALLFLALGFSYAVRKRHKRGRKKDDRYTSDSDVTDEESTELVTSDVFHRQ